MTDAVRTPDERFRALCELLQAMRAMLPQDAQSQQRRERLQKAKDKERERFRAEWSRLFAAYRDPESL